MQNEFMAMLHTAVAHHRAGRLAEAESLYNQVLKENPNASDALHLLGLILEARGELEKAASLIGQSVAVNPNFANAQESYARVLRAAGHAEAALAPAETLVTLRQDSIPARLQLGELLLEVGRADRAAVVFQGALALKPGDADLLFKSGEAQLALADLPEALRCFRDAIIQRPAFSVAFDRFDMVRRELEMAAAIHDTLDRNSKAAAAAKPADGNASHRNVELCNIYIRGFSRPFYIDRLIRSIERCVLNYGRIVLLNDGMGSVFIDKLKRDHPQLEVRNSPKVEGGVIAAPAGEAYQERKKFYRTLDFFDPARFWLREIRKDPNDYVVILDEDVWFFRDVDLQAMVESLQANRGLGAHLLYQKPTQRAQRQQRDPTVHREQIGCDTVLDYFTARIDSLQPDEGYRINPGSLTLKNYSLNAYEDCLHFADELHQNHKTLRVFTRVTAKLPDIRMGIVDGGVTRHSSSSTARPDAGGKSLTARIAPDVFHDLLSRHWLEGRLDTMADFPNDFSIDRLVALMRGHIPEEQITAWIEWQRDFVRMYHWLD